MNADSETISQAEMLRRLPQRYPFLFVDRVLSWDVRSRVLVAIKNVTANEPFFQGHFPGDPVMPGMLIVEAMGQSACLVASLLAEPARSDGAHYYLAVADDMRFRRLVRPGDVLTLHARCESIKGRFCRVRCHCEADGERVAEGVVVLAKKANGAP